ncbi:MAG: Citrate (pro-3S)-lyase [Marmoricola sp.]|nr:Citrate (pro-3S)-lyase [Marmoricola sp.]
MTASPAAPRSCLSVPGSSARMLAKASASDADEIVIDLEDAVATGAKDDARAEVVAFLAAAKPGRRIAVRVNVVGSRWCHQDLIALGSLAQPPASLVVPKVESVGDIAFVERLLTGVTGQRPGTGIRLQALIESATGLVAVDEIAGSGASLEALVLGYADLSASLGRAPDLGGWEPARERLLWAARAHGLRAVDGPHLGIAVDEDFESGVRAATSSGFDGKWIIHPAQIAAVNTAFSPDATQIAWAEQVLAALVAAERDGLGAVALDGDMLDEAVAVRARRVLARSGGTG